MACCNQNRCSRVGRKVRVKAGYLAGREGVVVEESSLGVVLKVELGGGLSRPFLLTDLEFLPEPASARPIVKGDRVVVIKPGWDQGRAGRVHSEWNDGLLNVTLDGHSGVRLYGPEELEGIPEDADRREPEAAPARVPTLETTLAGVARWQQRDAANRRAHFIAEPALVGHLQAHTVEIHVVTVPPSGVHGLLCRTTKFHKAMTEDEVAESLDALMASPPGTNVRVSDDVTEAVVARAERSPAYYGPAGGID